MIVLILIFNISISFVRSNVTGDELGEQGHGSLPRAGAGDGLVQEDTVRWLGAG